MSATLDQIRDMSPEEILANYDDPQNFTTDIFGIATKMGIKIQKVDFHDVEQAINYNEDSILGAVIDRNEDLTILLKKDLGNNPYYANKTPEEKEIILRRRQRFTLAHEIAHACIHLPYDTNKFRVDLRTELDSLTEEASYDEREFRANVFAGKLLIPEKELKYIYERLIYPSLDALCDFFDVSHPVMEARLKYLNLRYVVE